ncbi:MAG: DUF4294 domain-containing protein, partial [Dysgonamonadaceae bacterium]|nr:DUF4294 domain-containing protein [Dysgonamonadaceae bacterium]
MKTVYITIIILLAGVAHANDTTRISTTGNNNDTLKVLFLDNIHVFPQTTRQLYANNEKYVKMVRDIKRTLPYAKLIYQTLIETYEYIMTFDQESERQKHLKIMEKELFAQYKPVLKKLTVTQGKLLIKLIDRECNQSSYDLLKAFLGPIRARFWNLFAGIFGASLKTQWDPDGNDKDKEQIIRMIEQG